MTNLETNSFRRRLRAINGRLAYYTSLARTRMLHALQLTDRDMWSHYEFPQEWTQRLKRIGELVPSGSNVFEFGSGPIGLQAYLDPSCRLVSFDVVQHTPESRFIDLNRRPLPELGDTTNQVAVFAGILEYLSDVPSLLSWSAKHFELCIASYECAESNTQIRGRMREVLNRTHLGWVNHFTESDLMFLFEKAGFESTVRTSWGVADPGQIFVFRLRAR